jgi:copper homeostasis protein (lipoprotein)
VTPLGEIKNRGRGPTQLQALRDGSARLRPHLSNRNFQLLEFGLTYWKERILYVSNRKLFGSGRRKANLRAALGGFAFLLSIACLILMVAFEMPALAGGTSAESHDAAATLGNLPATFTGNLPCADCPGIEYHLDLFPAGFYFMRMTYLERKTHFDEIGRWSLAPGARKLILRGGATRKTQLAIHGEDVLRMLDGDGNEIPTGLNYDLKRASSFVPIEPRLTMQGMYEYAGDRALFAECLTGQQWTVANDKNGAEAQKLYAQGRPATGEKLLAGLDGQLTVCPNESNTSMDQTLTIVRSVRFSPGRTCASK